ncbi:MAG TPA: DinB family protein [Ilumatobacteraceae bacterium]|nr:DinB family protein [Ilumatobacteraceae bacterium]
MSASMDDVLNDLVAEYDCLDAVLSLLSDDQWSAPSGAPGWTVRDVVVHLAQTEEGVAVSLAAPVAGWTTREGTLDEAVDARVHADETPASEVLDRWRSARRSSVAALAIADPGVVVRWAAAPLKPKTLATTRLAEHWAHRLDICEPFGLEVQDTDRLRHVAWLGHATLPYAMQLARLDPIEVRCTLDAPSGAVWTYGPSTASHWVTGSGGAFCRVGARRIAAEDSGLDVSGPVAAAALGVLRNYAA